MFAVEVSFDDGLSRPELLLVRRPEAIIGASDYAHVVIDELRNLGYQLKIWRKLGRHFAFRKIGGAQDSYEPQECEGRARVHLPPVSLVIHALDCDFGMRDDETLDRASVRIARAALASASPVFPAVGVLGGEPIYVSFGAQQELLVGRSNQCQLRLDSSEISARHARVGFERDEFWVEDLGSTNGTFVNQVQISGRSRVVPGETIRIGRETLLYPLRDHVSFERLQSSGDGRELQYVREEAGEQFPSVLAISSVARPGRIVLRPGKPVVVGRDPKSEVWLGVPHVSRSHLTITLVNPHTVRVSDHSTNGTAYDGGILRSAESIDAQGRPVVLHFGGDVTLAICFSEEDEELFRAHEGAPETFQEDGVGTVHRSSSIIGTHVERTKKLYVSLSFPMKVLVVTVIVLFLFMSAQLIGAFAGEGAQ